MKNGILVGLLSLLLFSCDREIMCDCFDQSDDAIHFSFDTSDQGFKPEEIDTFYLFQLAKNQPNVIDTTTFIYDPVRGSHINRDTNNSMGLNNGFVLNHGYPYEDRIFSDFDYLVEIPRIKTYQLTNIEIAGIKGEGECGCYANTKKLATVNGMQYDLTGKDPQQNAIVLSK